MEMAALTRAYASISGAAVHGWPDPTYFERLAGECYAQGITLATDRGCDQGGVHAFGSDRP